jgi:glucose/arabinose dehydrogenase
VRVRQPQNAARRKHGVYGHVEEPAVEAVPEALVPVPIAGPFELPWSIGFLPDGSILITEKPGRLSLVRSDKAPEQVQGLPPVLVVSTTNDPATPYKAGVALAKALDGGLITYEATQHTVFLQGNPCVDDAGATYLVELKLPKEGTRCKP